MLEGKEIKVRKKRVGGKKIKMNAFPRYHKTQVNNFRMKDERRKYNDNKGEKNMVKFSTVN